MSTFIAAYQNVSSARRALQSLLGDGISPDDISMVCHAEVTELNGDGVGKLEDASFMIGRDDDPIDNPAARMDDTDPNRIRYVQESNIGGGISTATIDDSADNVEQMDDSQSAAEEMISPPEDRPASRHEVDDLQLTLDSGFPTPVPVIDPVTDAGIVPNHEYDESLDTLPIPGFGLVMGGGALATVALDFVNRPPAEGSNRFRAFLENEGVPGEQAHEMLQAVESGGAVLAVAVIPGETDPDALEVLAEQTGASKAALFDTPRF